jgi:hypothetical protein
MSHIINRIGSLKAILTLLVSVSILSALAPSALPGGGPVQQAAAAPVTDVQVLNLGPYSPPTSPTTSYYTANGRINPKHVRVGQMINYVVRVRSNNWFGVVPATDVILTTDVSGAGKARSATPSVDCDVAPDQASCDLGDLFLGQVKTSTLRVKATREGRIVTAPVAEAMEQDVFDWNDEAVFKTRVLPRT